MPTLIIVAVVIIMFALLGLSRAGRLMDPLILTAVLVAVAVLCWWELR